MAVQVTPTSWTARCSRHGEIGSRADVTEPHTLDTEHVYTEALAPALGGTSQQIGVETHQ